MHLLHRPQTNATIRIGVPVYVYDMSRERTVRLELTSTATVRWATLRALIALDDYRDPDSCRLRHNGTVLNPRKTLADSDISGRATLELVDQHHTRSRFDHRSG